MPRFRKPNVKKICKQCGVEYDVRPHEADRRRFCGLGCVGQWNSENRRGENCPAWKGGKVKKTCEVCGVEYDVRHVRKDTSRFCSLECFQEWYTENQNDRTFLAGADHPNWKGGKAKKTCEVCFKEYDALRSRVNYRRTCSKRCMGKRQRGENNQSWLGGLSFEPYGVKFNDALREQIRIRDGHTCRECSRPEGENGKALSVHHIDYDKQNNHPDNLIALCQKCHGKTGGERSYWQARFTAKMEDMSRSHQISRQVTQASEIFMS